MIFPEQETNPMWKCTGCGETVDDNFDVCWNCQRDKNGLPQKSNNGEPPAGGLRELPHADGSIEVEACGRRLSCVVCGNTSFHERNSLLNTRLATFFKFDWANVQAVNYICTRCGYIFWFLPE
jgi:predicted nucleic-acid-binding Zn-ribbon protein